ncbi:MAG TPA: metallophosphoesterase [Bryobacteraceae bacterium]|nr:metallophosphoesterase [Bryobacteraceae bacterium]
MAHCSGALWLPETRVAIVADVHLGYGWAQRRRGQLGPVEDGGVRGKIQALVQELGPAKIVFLGDVVHAPKPAAQERALVEETLRGIAGTTQLIMVRGNHDRAFAHDYAGLGMEVVDCWTAPGLMAIHGDRPPRERSPRSRLILGHLHPAVGVRDDAGASQRIPVFLIGPQACVLPAFSPFAAGYDVRSAGIPAGLRNLMGGGSVDCIAATGRRVVKLGPLSILRQRE